MKKLFILLQILLVVSLHAQDSTKISGNGSFAFKYQFQNTNYVSTRLQEKNLLPLSLSRKTGNIDPVGSEVDYNALYWVSGITAVSLAGIHFYQANAWWSEQDSRFRVVQDWKYALYVDKIGHFFGTNIMAHGFSMGLEAANFTTEQTYLYGGIMAFLFELYIEVEDGFGLNWGFSPGDATADFLGATYFISQYYFPYMKNFQPRFSYYPSEEMLNGTHKGGHFSDDYEGQKFWLSMRMKQILPEKVAQYWPEFLMLSVGMGVKDLDGSGGGKREVYIGLDFDAETIPLYGPFWQSVKNTLNYIHFPLPAIRISPDAAFVVFGY